MKLYEVKSQIACVVGGRHLPKKTFKSWNGARDYVASAMVDRVFALYRNRTGIRPDYNRRKMMYERTRRRLTPYFRHLFGKI